MSPDPDAFETLPRSSVRADHQRAFPGRVIFDHLPKTAGMAINRWLQTALGSGCASPNLVSDHRDLIARYGGVYSVLTAHVKFSEPGLDPRYHYVTLFREPIERLVSWLYYVVTNHSESQLGQRWQAAKKFLEDDNSEILRLPLANPLVRHFAAIEGGPSDSDTCGSDTCGSDTRLLAAALAAVDRYDVWGVYEALPEFLDDFAALLGVAAPTTLERVNVTRQRPTMADVDDRLRARLTEMNGLDLEFYAILKGRYAEARRRWSRTTAPLDNWKPFPSPPPFARVQPGFRLLSATVAGGRTHAPGSLLECDCSFSLAVPVADLEVGLVIHDAVGSRVFHTNTELLGRPIGQRAAGTYQVRGTVLAQLPEGDYALGLRFHERLPNGRRELAALNRVAEFRIGSTERLFGYQLITLPATIHCTAVKASNIASGWQLPATDASLGCQVGRIEGASIVSDGRAGFVLFGPYRTLVAGHWRAVVEGSFEPDTDCVRMDVVSGTGRTVHAECELRAPTPRAEVIFHLDQTVRDLEIRVWVHETAAVRIDAVAIEHPSAMSGGDTETTPTGDPDHGIDQSRVAAVREAEAAADSAAAETAARQVRASVADERADGAAARRLVAGGHSAGRGEDEGLDRGVGDPPAGPAGAACHPRGRPGGHGAHHARVSIIPGGPGRRSGRGLGGDPRPTFSIVIATDGRAAAVAELLESLPFLEGPPFEVCIVRGPTEDGIADVLETWRGRIKTACNPIRNLSVSRNIGIALAAGEIIAFLDDDAIPETDWLVDLAEAFQDPAVACAGGVNRDRTGSGLQYGYATANRMGQARWDHTRPADDLCTPGAPDFPYTQGTNTAIRRCDLELLGGFDEEYEFYLDETDLCCRLVDAGRLIRQLPRAYVHHRSLPSAIRTQDGVTHSLFSVLKNKLYFSLVNNHGHHTVSDALDDFAAFVTIQERHLQRMAASSADGPRWLTRFKVDAASSRVAGLARGTSGLRRLMSPGLIERQRQPFLPFPRRDSAELRSCTLHSRTSTPAAARSARDTIADPLREQRELLRRTWAERVPPGSQVALALYPDHWNVGDAAIWWGTRSLLASLGVTVAYGCDPWTYDPDHLARRVPRGPILLLGGGNLGDVYDGEQGLRLRILRDFPDRPIIQLPQSIWFRDPAARDALAELLRTRRNTTLLLRDAASLAYARTHFPVPSLLCPDSALALDLTSVRRRGDVPVVALWRRDVELDLPLPRLPADWIVTDWQDLEPAPGSRSLRSRAFRAVVGDRPLGDRPLGDRARLSSRRAAWRFAPGLWDAVAEERAVRGCQLLARGRVVITNRLHGHLLCSLLGIPHVVCDTVNGKLSAYLQTWNAGGPLVHGAATPADAVALAGALASAAPLVRSQAA